MQVITSSGIKLRIDDTAEIHRGGEGRILLLAELPTQVAKIYLPHIKPISAHQLNALQVLDSQLFIKPKELILNPKNQAVLGFTMDYLQADFLPLAAFFNVQYCRKLQVDFAWKTAVLQKILQGIVAAHNYQIVLGDLSGLNILVNPQGEVRMIDVDAYQTPAQPHSGLLLDEIRDYFYHGNVSITSDYFAFAVIAFNLLAYTHPFKGIHKTYKTLQERMIHLLPVFKADKDLVVPKCYEPVAVAYWQQQFEEIFEQGNRYLLQLAVSQGQIAPTNLQKMPQNIQPQPTHFTSAELLMHDIYTVAVGEVITEVVAVQSRLLLKTNLKYLVYDTSNYGNAKLLHEFNRKNVDFEAEDVFIGRQQILAKKGSQLFVYQANKGFLPLQNTTFGAASRYLQIDNLLVVIEQEALKTLFLDEINQDFIRMEQTAAFGRGIHIASGGLWQQVGGRQYLFYHSGKTLSSVLVPFALQDVYLDGNQGVITYKEQQIGNEVTLKHAFFSLQNLTFQLKETLTSRKAIAFKATNAANGLVFEATDNQLCIRRTEDFVILQTLQNDLLTEQTQLFSTQAGIVAFENNRVVLLNKKA